MPFTLHEPFPTYSHHASIPFGRGGAGNRTSTSPSKPLPPNTLANNNNTTSSTSNLHAGPSYSTGRGGAGNMHSSSSGDRTVFHFDEELEQEKRRLSNAAPVYHVGRGGTGNMVNAKGPSGSERRGSESSGSGSEKGSKKSLEWVKGVVGKK